MSVKKMRDSQKTEAELLQELNTLRKRVAKLMQTEEVLRESEGKWRSLLNNTPDIVMIVDRDGTIRFINHAVPGITDREAIGKKVYDYISPEHHDAVRRDLERIFQTGQDASHEVSVVGRHGTLSWYQAELGPIRQNRRIVAASIVARDVTERRRAEDALRESEEGFRDFFENVAVGVYRTTPDGQILVANPALVHMLGYSSFKELSRRNLEEEGFEPQYPRSKFKEEIEREGRIVSSESTWITRDGKKLHVIENARAVRDEDGKTLYYEGTAENITERRRAEGRLKQTAEKWESTFNAIKDLVSIQDKDFKFVRVNKAFGDAFNMKPEEITGKICYELVHGAKEPPPGCPHKQTFDTKKPHRAEFFEPHLGIHLEVSTSPIFDERGGIIGSVHIAKDITERKNTEQSLRESEERLRVALSAAQMGTWRWDPVTNQDTRDASLNMILGLEAVESTQPVDDFIQRVHPEDQDMVDAEIQRSLHEHRTYVAEFRIIRPDGTVRWLRDQGKPLYDENDHILYLTGAVVDITEHRRAEDALRESEKKYKVLFQGAAEGIIVADTETREFKYVNPAICTMLGYTEDELEQMGVRDIHPKEDLEYIISEFEAQARGEKTLTSNIPCLRKDGTIMYVDISTAMVLIDGRQCNVGFFTDITEIKRAEMELNEYRDKMAHAERLASLGTLSATLAHELNQPLTAIRLSIENSLAELETTSSPETVIEDLKDGLSAVSDVASKVNVLRDFAQKSSKEIISEVNLKAVAERIFNLLNESALRAKVTLQLEGMEELPHMRSNEKDLEQLFFALVENAIEAADGKKSRRL
ncbi:MAG: PAS domain-containing protein, partial [Planctomycetota bacterium]